MEARFLKCGGKYRLEEESWMEKKSGTKFLSSIICQNWMEEKWTTQLKVEEEYPHDKWKINKDTQNISITDSLYRAQSLRDVESSALRRIAISSMS